MFLQELIERIGFWRSVDRIGPDIPWTHWRLHFRSTQRALCQKRFRRFPYSAEFRPGAYAVACSKIEIGERVVIRPGTMLLAHPGYDGPGIVIEDDVLIGAGVHIYNANHAFRDPGTPIIDQGHSPARKVVLRRGCWIGANVTILAGVEIGENAVIGAGSVVTRSVPAHTVAVGNPAHPLRKSS